MTNKNIRQIHSEKSAGYRPDALGALPYSSSTAMQSMARVVSSSNRASTRLVSILYSSPLSRLCGILALSGYRKRTLHFRLLPMVKCPLDCFLVYSFLLDVELAKIRHAPFGIFAFSDKPLRNPSEHSGFWYIQGRIFSSCGLS